MGAFHGVPCSSQLHALDRPQGLEWGQGSAATICAYPRLRRARLRLDDFAKKAGDGARVTGGARRFDLNQQRIPVAVEMNADDFLDVAAGGALVP